MRVTPWAPVVGLLVHAVVLLMGLLQCSKINASHGNNIAKYD